MRIQRITAALGAAALAVTLLPTMLSSAAANEAGVSVLARRSSWAVTDTANDVWVYTSTDGYQFLGAQPRADVLRATAQHTKRNIITKMTFDDIVLGDQQQFSVQVKTKKMTRYGYLYFSSGDTTGGFFMEKPGRISTSSKGVTWAVDDVKDKILITLPRRLFKDPAWVRIAMFNQYWSADGYSLLQDNPHNKGALDESTWLDTPPLSPKLYPR